jgi:hypothetical protein
MEGLIQMLKNVATGKWHPIMYVEKPLPGSLDSDANNNIVRFKSKGHHTSGFTTREEAVATLEELKFNMINLMFLSKVTIDVETDIEWTSEDLPLDTQIRPRT